MLKSENAKILIIDDSQSVINLISELLKKNNFKVAAALDGASGMAKARAILFDLILLDINLPDISGFELCKKLISHHKNHYIPVIFITVRSDKNSLLEGFKSGAVDYIYKPFDEFELLARIRTHLELKFSKEQIIKEKQKAVQSDKLKSVFLSNMSHEIRTPMNAVIGFSELLKYTEYSEEQKEKYIDIVIHNGNKLIKLIDDIIDISKIEAGELKTSKTKVNVDNIFKDIYSSYSALLEKDKEKKVTIECNLPHISEVFIMLTDELRLYQIVNNLVSNAYKFTEKGSILFGYYLTDDKLVIYVKDTGKGISKENLENIFKRFYRESDITQYHGTGLGLTITKTLTEMLDGSISVKSKPEEGTVFTVKLPHHGHKERESTKIIKNNKKEYDWTGKTILIADDVRSTLDYYKGVMRKAGADIIFARNGEEALELYKKNSEDIDIILMDLQMPVMDGYTATAEIRKLNSDIPVIAQTALAMPEDKEKAIQAGHNECLFKPVSIAKLVETVNRYLSI